MAFKIQAFKLFKSFSLSLNALYCADWSESKYLHKDTYWSCLIQVFHLILGTNISQNFSFLSFISSPVFVLLLVFCSWHFQWAFKFPWLKLLGTLPPLFWKQYKRWTVVMVSLLYHWSTLNKTVMLKNHLPLPITCQKFLNLYCKHFHDTIE